MAGLASEHQIPVIEMAVAVSVAGGPARVTIWVVEVSGAKDLDQVIRVESTIEIGTVCCSHQRFDQIRNVISV